MAALRTFRHYRISQDRNGGTVELWRSGTEVACLAVDTQRHVFVELHVAVLSRTGNWIRRPFSNWCNWQPRCGTAICSE